MAGQKRNRTEERNIYYNNVTEKYDIKYNYKIYNSAKQKMSIRQSGNMV